MNKIRMVALVMLLNITGFAQIPSDTTLSIEIINRSKAPVPIPRIFSLNGYVGVVSNTQPDVLYEFQYKQNRTNWISLGFNNGSEITNVMIFNIPTNLVPPNNRAVTAKQFRVRSWKDSYDMGIPDWWQMRYFGNIGIDAYANPVGDGWKNLQKFQQAMNPFKYYHPPGPQSQFLSAYSVHYPGMPFFTELREITAITISNTILSVTAKQVANGYELTVLHPMIHARYLLLVRDKIDSQWRASGYFVSGTNRDPVYLHVDKKGIFDTLGDYRLLSV